MFSSRKRREKIEQEEGNLKLLRNKSEELASLISELNTKIHSKKLNHKQLSEKIKDQQTTRDNLASEIIKLDKRITEAKKKYDELEENAVELEEEIGELKEEAVELETIIDQKKEELSAFVSDFINKEKAGEKYRRINLNVGGTKYSTTYDTLVKYSSYFQAMFSGKFSLETDDEGYFFIDRNGRLFEYVLEYSRNDSCQFLELYNGHTQLLFDEFKFYGFDMDQAKNMIETKKLSDYKRIEDRVNILESCLIASTAVLTTHMIRR